MFVSYRQPSVLDANNYFLILLFKIPMVIVGNKIDLEDERLVSKEQGQALAKQFSCTFLEASAKYRVNVPEVYKTFIKK